LGLYAGSIERSISLAWALTSFFISFGALDRLFDRKDLLVATGPGSGTEAGSTSARQAGQWKTPSGRRRISG
jgi:hypothetical protein